MSQSFRYCPHCGTQNPREAEECIKCGLVFSKFKPLSISVEKQKKSKFNFLIIVFSFVFIFFISYMLLVVWIEKKYLKIEEKSEGIYKLSLKLEEIYKNLPPKSSEEKEKHLREIEHMEKLISTFPVSEDMEKINLFEENLRDIKEIILKDQNLDFNIQRKIEGRFNKLK